METEERFLKEFGKVFGTYFGFTPASLNEFLSFQRLMKFKIIIRFSTQVEWRTLKQFYPILKLFQTNHQ